LGRLELGITHRNLGRLGLRNTHRNLGRLSLVIAPRKWESSRKLSSLYRIMIKTRGIIVWFHHTCSGFVDSTLVVESNA
jgi:hypothetical protein